MNCETIAKKQSPCLDHQEFVFVKQRFYNRLLQRSICLALSVSDFSPFTQSFKANTHIIFSFCLIISNTNLQVAMTMSSDTRNISKIETPTKVQKIKKKNT